MEYTKEDEELFGVSLDKAKYDKVNEQIKPVLDKYGFTREEASDEDDIVNFFCFPENERFYFEYGISVSKANLGKLIGCHFAWRYSNLASIRKAVSINEFEDEFVKMLQRGIKWGLSNFFDEEQHQELLNTIKGTPLEQFIPKNKKLKESNADTHISNKITRLGKVLNKIIK